MEKANHEKLSSHRTATSRPLSRREFLKRIGVLGGGIVVYFSYGDPLSLAQPSSEARREFSPDDFYSFIEKGQTTQFSGGGAHCH